MGQKGFVKIGSVTGEILLTLSFCGWGGVCTVIIYVVKPNLVLRLGWGFDNIQTLFLYVCIYTKILHIQTLTFRYRKKCFMRVSHVFLWNFRGISNKFKRRLKNVIQGC